MSQSGLIIRDAEDRDLSLLFRMSQCLGAASVNRRSDSFGLSEDFWKLELFQDARIPLVKCFVAVNSSSAEYHGYILAHSTYSTWDGLRIFVDQIYACASDNDLGSIYHALLCNISDWGTSIHASHVEILQSIDDAMVIQSLQGLSYVDMNKHEGRHFCSLSLECLRQLSEKPVDSRIAIFSDSTTSAVLKPLFRIRWAVKEDCVVIMSMINDLAEFEGILDQVKINVEDLERDGFSGSPLFRVMIAEDSNRIPVGYVAVFFGFSMAGFRLFLLDIFVIPSCRGKGIASALFKAVSRFALDSGCSSIELGYLDWNAAALKVYEHFGFVDVTRKYNQHLCELALTSSK